MLIESANAPIFGVDNAGRVTEWNSKASAITGYSGEEMLGSLLVEAEVVLPEFKSAMQQVISNAMSGISNPTPTPTPTPNSTPSPSPTPIPNPNPNPSPNSTQVGAWPGSTMATPLTRRHVRFRNTLTI